MPSGHFQLRRDAEHVGRQALDPRKFRRKVFHGVLRGSPAYVRPIRALARAVIGPWGPESTPVRHNLPEMRDREAWAHAHRTARGQHVAGEALNLPAQRATQLTTFTRDRPGP